MELKPCKSICYKCGWDDIRLTYRPVGESLKYYFKYSSEYTDLYKVTKEHIHYQCTKCGYTWDTEPMNTRAPDPLLKEMAEALECIKEMVQMNGFGRAYAMDVVEIALQKYHEQED